MLPANEAIALYERTRRRGWWHRLAAWMCGRPTRLLDLTVLMAGGTIRAQHYLGAQTVPLRLIRGTEGRRDTFDDAFHPIERHIRERWLGIATAWLQGVALPPVELIRLGEFYAVRDGHHRISVVHALGIAEIDAIVTAWDVTAVPQPVSALAGVSQGATAGMGAVRVCGRAVSDKPGSRCGRPSLGAITLEQYTNVNHC